LDELRQSRQFDARHTTGNGLGFCSFGARDKGQFGTHPGYVAHLRDAIQWQSGQLADSHATGNVDVDARGRLLRPALPSLLRERLNKAPGKLLASVVGAQRGAYTIHLLVVFGVQAGSDGIDLAPFRHPPALSPDERLPDSDTRGA
jgi:hypothetical protein